MTGTTARRRAFGAATLAAALVLTACGGGGEGGGVASAGGEGRSAATEDAVSLNEDAQVLAFAECMRDNGVDMPDPAPGRRGLIVAFREVEEGVDRATIDEARAACDDLLPQFGHDGDDPRQDDELVLALAECMRNKGFDVSDNLNELQGHDAADTAEFRAALAECRNEVLGGDQ